MQPDQNQQPENRHNDSSQQSGHGIVPKQYHTTRQGQPLNSFNGPDKIVFFFVLQILNIPKKRRTSVNQDTITPPNNTNECVHLPRNPISERHCHGVWDHRCVHANSCVLYTDNTIVWPVCQTCTRWQKTTPKIQCESRCHDHNWFACLAPSNSIPGLFYNENT